MRLIALDSPGVENTPAMLRRGAYHTGTSLPRGPEGLIGTGLGQTSSSGTVTLLPPTADITHTGQQETVDGVRIEFQVTPGTEAPADMNFFFPVSASCAWPRTRPATRTTS